MEQTQENSNTVAESIEFEVKKFKTLGREFYNYSERKNFNSEKELKNYLVGKSKPFFEMRDYKIYKNSRNRPIDVLYMRVFSRNMYLTKISEIIQKLVDKKYPHLTLAKPEYYYYKDAKFYARPRSKEPKQPKKGISVKIIQKQKEFTEKKLAEAELGSQVKTGFTDKNREKIKKPEIKRTFSEMEDQSGSPGPCQPTFHQIIYNNYNFQAQLDNSPEPPAQEVSAVDFFT